MTRTEYNRQYYQKRKHDPVLLANQKAASDRWRRNLSPERKAARNRRSSLRMLYGITPEQFEALKKKQDGVCAICRQVPTPYKNRTGFCVDHDHETGKVRGALCHRCNTALERVESILDWGQLAMAYLKGEY